MIQTKIFGVQCTILPPANMTDIYILLQQVVTPMEHEVHNCIKLICKKYKICCPLLTTVVSGSPIIQNGKLVGAVTHVFINNPLRGYGIFIENMLAE